MNHPYNKHAALLGRDLTPVERMEGVRATITWTRRLLDQIDRTLENLPEDLGQDQANEDQKLETIARAVHQIYAAAENVAFLGDDRWQPNELQTIYWLY
jgi:hypothetical protein